MLLYRDDSPNVFCRIKKPDVGGWVQRGTGVTGVDEALRMAEEWHDEIRFKAKHGLAIEPKAFRAVADVYVRELREEVDLGVRNERHLKDYVPVVKRYLNRHSPYTIQIRGNRTTFPPPRELYPPMQQEQFFVRAEGAR